MRSRFTEIKLVSREDAVQIQYGATKNRRMSHKEVIDELYAVILQLLLQPFPLILLKPSSTVMHMDLVQVFKPWIAKTTRC